MISKPFVACLSLAVPLLLAPYVVKADVVSLYLPDTEPVAMSADILGVDGSHTTWRLSPGQASGTLSSADFPAATLVEGPDFVHVVEDVEGARAQADCGIKDGVAVCTPVLSVSGTATTLPLYTETVSGKAFAVQVTHIPKNGASRMANSGLGAAGVVMGVVYGLMF
ncbi:hypothetical protein OH76DRAFT_1487677 [Lentinus brumalis]|uniref:Uncharacterized protein n=1 Tax=Lentinus brumalis TaxID=2498619 RepID=A0A371CTP7_9APHY|nr:hypothetical protein OH76DRAFT_1487677 [Polyporus brumalis]